MGARACAASVMPSGRWRLLAADGVAGVAKEVPHASQNLAPGRFSIPQALQCKGSGAAHSLQNFAPVRFSQSQRGQRMVMPSCYVNLQEKKKTLPLSGTSHYL